MYRFFKKAEIIFYTIDLGMKVEKMEEDLFAKCLKT